MAVSEATLGTPVTPSDNGGLAVTLLSSGGVPVIFIGVDGVLWPGGVAPGSGEPDARMLWGVDRIMWGSDRILWAAIWLLALGSWNNSAQWLDAATWVD